MSALVLWTGSLELHVPEFGMAERTARLVAYREPDDAPWALAAELRHQDALGHDSWLTLPRDAGDDDTTTDRNYTLVLEAALLATAARLAKTQKKIEETK